MRHFAHRLLLLLWLGSAPLLAQAEVPEAYEPVDRPFTIGVKDDSGERVAVRVTGRNEAGIWVVPKSGPGWAVGWETLELARVFKIESRLLGRATAERWLAVAARMLERDEETAETWARRAARRARLDPDAEGLDERIERLFSAGADGGEAPGAGHRDPGQGRGPDPRPGPSRPRVQTPGREAMPDRWPPVNESEHEALVAEAHAFAQKAGRALDRSLAHAETRFFIFYTDLDRAEARNWARELDRMYARLADLFGLEEGENIWRGKALVFTFRDAEHYRLFEDQVMGVNPGTSAGMAHGFSDGRVVIAFYRQSDRDAFAHLLVHETVHGFLHRYRSPRRIPSWANEGLAELIAGELVEDPRRRAWDEKRVLERLSARGAPGPELFEVSHIQGPDYPVAWSLTRFMMKADRRRYAAFINGIKDGLAWEASLEKHFGTTRQRLVKAWMAQVE